jgi:mannose-6-phosphate isomerase-like protein (cupin superfamily)
MSKASEINWPLIHGSWIGEFIGEPYGSGVCVIFNSWKEPGGGPAMHRHPYSETFIVREGRVLFEVDGNQLEAKAGQIIVVPAGAAHKFTSLGPGPIEMIDIHASGSFITEWLEHDQQ